MSESALYRQIFEGFSEGIAILNPETTRFEEVNRAYADVLRYDPSELEGTSITEHAEESKPSDGDSLSTNLERVRLGESHQCECVFNTGDGNEQPVELTFELLAVDDEHLLLSTIQRVRDQETKGRANEKTVQRLNVALSGTNTGVWEWDMESDEVIWTESMEQLFGLEPGTFEGTFEAFADRVHPEDLPEVQSAITTAVEQDDIFEIEYRIERDDGEQLWGYARSEIHEAANGTKRMIGIVTDITRRKEQEQALRRQDRQFKELVERLPDAYYTLDSEWNMTFCNEVLANRLGKSAENYLGKSVWEAFPNIRDSILEDMLRGVKETQEPASCEYHVEDYGYWIEAQAYPYDDGIAVISTDITERKEKLTMVLDSMPLILYQIDSDGIFQESRGKGLSTLGLEPNEVVGESVFDVYAGTPEVIEAVEQALDGEQLALTVGVEDIYFRTHFKPIFESGEVAGIIGVSMDVSELERQREQMEFFNSILRHDVLNGMTVIKTRGELLAEQLKDEQAQYAQTIVDWCNTTTEVTQRVQRVVETLTTPDEDKRVEPIDVSAILRRKITELQNAHPEVEFEGDFAPSVRVRADEMLSAVLGNVLLNSIEHNETDGLHIKATVENEDGVTIRIADNGTGIDDDRKESVFRRGATSHAKETGSGFGLFFVDAMVEKYGGEVWVEDTDTGGACFVIDLLRANGGAEE